MLRAISLLFFLGASVMMAAPASAQYRFDPRIDPQMCHWWEICDYGGRAYVRYRHHYHHHRHHVRHASCERQDMRRDGNRHCRVRVRY